MLPAIVLSLLREWEKCAAPGVVVVGCEYQARRKRW